MRLYAIMRWKIQAALELVSFSSICNRMAFFTRLLNVCVRSVRLTYIPLTGDLHNTCNTYPCSVHATCLLHHAIHTRAAVHATPTTCNTYPCCRACDLPILHAIHTHAAVHATPYMQYIPVLPCMRRPTCNSYPCCCECD